MSPEGFCKSYKEETISLQFEFLIIQCLQAIVNQLAISGLIQTQIAPTLYLVQKVEVGMETPF
jgi:hypothetical protein